MWGKIKVFEGKEEKGRERERSGCQRFGVRFSLSCPTKCGALREPRTVPSVLCEASPQSSLGCRTQWYRGTKEAGPDQADGLHRLEPRAQPPFSSKNQQLVGAPGPKQDSISISSYIGDVFINTRGLC